MLDLGEHLTNNHYGALTFKLSTLNIGRLNPNKVFKESKLFATMPKYFEHGIVIVIVIVLSAKSTNFTTNTRYHVDPSVDEPHRLQQRVLV